MEITAENYIAKHPKSTLAKELKKYSITGEISVSSGLIAPNTKSSKLYKMLQRPNAAGYIIGGRAGQNANDGYTFAVYYNKKNPSVRKKQTVNTMMKKTNPIQHTVERMTTHAAENFKRFHGEEPTNVDKVKIPDFGNVGFVIGELQGVIYGTVRDGKAENYIHKFKKSSRPVLISNHDGTQLRIIGGKYHFTEDGIVDL